MNRISIGVAILALAGCQGTIGGRTDIDNEEVARSRQPREARRLSATQLRSALVGATGFDYVGTASVPDPLAPRGTSVRDDAPLLEVYEASLGEPDFNYTVRQSIEASLTFSKLAEDGIRFACGELARAEVVGGEAAGEQPLLLVAADASAQLPADEAAIRQNIAALALRWWGQELDPSSEEVTDLLELFAAGHGDALPEPPPDGTDDPVDPIAPAVQRAATAWRTVCIGMLQDPRFLTY